MRQFQSLLGFLMRCDKRAIEVYESHKFCFNPCWVF